MIRRRGAKRRVRAVARIEAPCSRETAQNQRLLSGAAGRSPLTHQASPVNLISGLSFWFLHMISDSSPTSPAAQERPRARCMGVYALPGRPRIRNPGDWERANSRFFLIVFARIGVERGDARVPSLSSCLHERYRFPSPQRPALFGTSIAEASSLRRKLARKIVSRSGYRPMLRKVHERVRFREKRLRSRRDEANLIAGFTRAGIRRERAGRDD